MRVHRVCDYNKFVDELVEELKTLSLRGVVSTQNIKLFSTAQNFLADEIRTKQKNHRRWEKMSEKSFCLIFEAKWSQAKPFALQ